MRLISFSSIFYIVLFVSCKSDNASDNASVVNCSNLEFIPHYYEMLGDSNNASYGHYIYVKGFNEKCFNLTNFIEIAKKYVDTCKSNTPINFIAYVSSIEKFDSMNADYQDWQIIRKNELLGLYLKNNMVTGTQIFELEAIEFYSGSNKRVIRLNK